jgi:cytochrome c551/c552
MKIHLLAGLALVASVAAIPQVMAQDAADCMECHEPAEDWAGLTVDEIIVKAKDPGNKRHKGHSGLSDEQLRAIIIPLMPQ